MSGSSIVSDPGLRRKVAERLNRLDDWARDRFEGRVPDTHADLIVAHYLFGLTSVIIGASDPQGRIEFCLEMLEEIFEPERARQALFQAPRSVPASFAATCEKTEARGVQDGEAFVEEVRDERW